MSLSTLATLKNPFEPLLRLTHQTGFHWLGVTPLGNTLFLMNPGKQDT